MGLELSCCASGRSTSPNGTEFMDMNDDCVLNVLKHLSPHCLLAIASTCIRLRGLARVSFAAKDANKYLDLSLMVKFHSPLCIANFLRNFGDLIKEIDWNTLHLSILLAQSVQNNLFNLLLTYCGGGTLEKLRMNRINLNAPVAREAHKLFRHLKSFQWINCSHSEIAIQALSNNCTELIVPPKSIAALGGHSLHFANLEKLSMRADADELQWLESFLERHQRLKYLKLNLRLSDKNVRHLAALQHHKLLQYLELIILSDGGRRCITPLINGQSLCTLVVNDHILLNENVLTNLRKLALRGNPLPRDFDCTQLTKFEHLIEFELRSGRLLCPELYLDNLGSTTTLTQLTLDGGTISNDTIKALCRFTNLRVLQLRPHVISHIISDDHWSMLQRIDKLTKFECFYENDPSQIELFLRHLGTTDSLECLSLCRVIEAITRFHNLRVLQIKEYPPENPIEIYNTIIGMAKLEQLKLRGHRFPINKELINVIEVTPNLQTVTGIARMEWKTYCDLLEIGLRSNKKLVIELTRSASVDFQFNFKFDLIEINRHIVDICFEKEAFFNDFKL